MSTDHQQYSLENQADAIARYATERGFQIVKTYSDATRSGLRFPLNLCGKDFSRIRHGSVALLVFVKRSDRVVAHILQSAQLTNLSTGVVESCIEESKNSSDELFV